MAASFLEVGRVFVTRWIEPTINDIEEIRVRVRNLGQKLGKPPIYIAITPADSTPPSDGVRKEMLAKMGEMNEMTESLHLVLEGSGLKFSALRSIVASMFLVAGSRHTHVHDNLAGAIAKARLTEDEAAQVRQAVARFAAATSATPAEPSRR